MKNTLEKILGLFIEEELKNNNFLQNIQENIVNELKKIEWKEKYNIDIPEHINMRNTYFKLNNYYGDLYFSYYNDSKAELDAGKGGRYISWSEDNSQPLNEWLMTLSFGTGAYIFGDDYPVDLFEEFFNELKTLNHKFIDTHNRSIYWDLESAGNVLQQLPIITKKYQEKNKEDSKLRRIKKLQDELNKLSN